MVLVRSVMTSRLHAGGIQVRNCGSSGVDLVRRVDDVGVRLLENDQQHGALVVEQAGLLVVLLRVDRLADVAQMERPRRCVAPR